ncbi:MAG: hypothetical protein ABSE07_00005, partial [Methanoregula sp.]
MAGFNILYGDLISDTTIQEKLELHEQIRPLELDGQHFELLDKVTSFNIRPGGGIVLIYKWDERIPNTYRDNTEYILRTYSMGLRIIQSNKLIFLVELRAPPHYLSAIHQISKVLYSRAKGIRPVTIPSDLMKSIESSDSRMLTGEWCKGVNAKDRSVGVFGVLDERLENGTHNESDVHGEIKTKEKTFTSFLSLSTGFNVFISG